MNFSEKEIQLHIWNNRENFMDLVDQLTGLDEIETSYELYNLLPQNLLWNRVSSQIKNIFNQLHSLNIFAVEVPLGKDNDSTIRADFLGYFPGSPGVAIIELKKSEQTERQSFTELLAYSNHLSLIFPGLSRDDVLYILISPMKTRIAREAVVQSLAFDNRKIIAFMPRLEDENDLATLRLTPWVPSESDLSLFSNFAFNRKNLNVYKIVWKYSENDWDPPKGESLNCRMQNQLNTVSAFAAQKMEEVGIHGFVYCSQSWPELAEVLPYSNSLVLVGLNPYAVGGAKHWLNQNSSLIFKDDFYGIIPDISEILPGLKENGSGKNFEKGHFSLLEDLFHTWSSQLLRIGNEIVKFSTLKLDGSHTSIDQGSMNWDVYQKQIIEDVYCTNLDVRPTGLFRYLFIEVLKSDYKTVSGLEPETHILHDSLLDLSVSMMKSQSYFRDFINRMFDPGFLENFGLDDIFDENDTDDTEQNFVEVDDPFA